MLMSGLPVENDNFIVDKVYRMAVEGCGKIIKYAMIIANFIILVCGVAVFSVGVWILADKSYMERLIGSSMYVSSAAILIASGVIVVVISFLGCMGAYKEVKCMLITFFVILFIIFIIMLVGGILGYVFRDEVDEKMKKEMLKSIPLYGNESAVTEAWDRVQQNDCYDKTDMFVKDHALIIGGVGVGIACVLVCLNHYMGTMVSSKAGVIQVCLNHYMGTMNFITQ
ncbi:tetraspanin-9-like [Limulus polyphemus]|uniref:Tetraspanin-9-like n=1 Tax=Limulus polyphemus TaxID=6850 RepID=A0ABM1S5Y4_LIMPO|nr:tetraspanin-9-like [Limulus polyphemus]